MKGGAAHKIRKKSKLKSNKSQSNSFVPEKNKQKQKNKAPKKEGLFVAKKKKNKNDFFIKPKQGKEPVFTNITKEKSVDKNEANNKGKLVDFFKGKQKATKEKTKEIAPQEKPAKKEVFYPKSPQEDPAFKALENRVDETAQNQQTTNPATEESETAQKAAIVPSNERMGIAQAKQVDVMAEQEPGEFDAVVFKAQLMKRIEEMQLPANEEEAGEFEDHNNIQEVSNAASKQASKEQENVAGPISKATKTPPNKSAEPERETITLPKAPIGQLPAPVNANTAMPRKRPESQVSQPLKENMQEVDQQMVDNEVTEEQLAKSNEPKFTSALSSKNTANTNTQAAPTQFRQTETQSLNSSEQQAENTSKKELEGMHGKRTTALNGVINQQTQTGTKDTSERERIAGEINTIYEKTKTDVEDILNILDTEVTKKFDIAAIKAKQKFEKYVEKEMDAYMEERYGGWGVFKRITDVFVGLPDEVNEFFVEGRDVYIEAMDTALTDISNYIATKLNEAKNRIELGKQQVTDHVDKLPNSLKSFGKEAAENIQDKFDELTEDVNSKQEELVDSLAQQYSDSLAEVDERIDEMKAANRGLIDMALDAINGVIETIAKLKQLITDLLAEIQSVMSVIMADPIGFVVNLFGGIKQGFDNFVEKIETHLIGGFVQWLTGAMGPVGITLPKDIFSLKGIFSLVTQVLGLTWDYVRKKAVRLLGEPVVKAMEFGLEMFQLIKKEGLAGVWEYIKEQFDDLKETIIDSIKEMLITQVIEAGIKWLLSLLIPGAGFIKAIMAIKDFIVFFVESALMLIPALIEAIKAMAAGSVAGVAKAIEKGLGLLIPLVINLFARLIGLGGLVKKVQKIIKKVRKRIDKTINKLIKKARKSFKKLTKKGKAKVKKGIKKLLGWFKIKKTFKAKDGKKHSLSFKGSEKNPKLIVKSEPTEFEKLAKEILAGNDKEKKKKVDKALAIYKLLRKEVNRKIDKSNDTAVKKKEKNVKKHVDDLSKFTVYFFGHNEGDLPEYKKGINVKYDSVTSQGLGEKMNAIVLSKRGKEGSKPSVKNEAYNTLFKRKKGKGVYYVRGHLLNENVHGPGNDFKNLTPLSVKGNKNHLMDVEKILKFVAQLGGVVNYVVDPVYNGHNLTTDDKDRLDKFTDEEWEDVKNIRKVENTAVPNHLIIKAILLEKDDKGKFVEKKTIFTGNVKNPIETNIKDYEVNEKGIEKTEFLLRKKEVQEIMTLVGIGKVKAQNIYNRLNVEKKSITNFKDQIGIEKSKLDKANPNLKIIGSL